jgi:DegV family protein with EDD domain
MQRLIYFLRPVVKERDHGGKEMTQQLIVDSGCWLPRELLYEHNIIEVPLHITSEKEDWLDTAISLREIIEAQKSDRRFTTSQFNPEEAAEVFRKAADAGADEILALSLTSLDSGTYDSFCKGANIVREERPDVRIEVVDSFTTSMAHGLLALRVAEEMATGVEFDRVVDFARYHRWNMLMMAALNTLEFVQASGRAESLKIRAGSLLKLKATVILAPNRKIQEYGVHRTMKNACEAMIDTVVDQCRKDRKGVRLAVVHTDDITGAREVRRLLAEKSLIPQEAIMLTEASKALVVHAGPGAIGIAADCGQPVNWKKRS